MGNIFNVAFESHEDEKKVRKEVRIIAAHLEVKVWKVVQMAIESLKKELKIKI